MSLAQDLRIGLRMLGRKPAFAALAILTLALGIGANTAIFSVIHGVLLRPLPYPDSERLVQVWNKYPLMGLPRASVSIPDYLDRRAGVPAFEESALYRFASVNVTLEGPPERVSGLYATASLFPLLQSAPVIGRVFTEDDDRPGHDQVVVLGYRLWQRLGGDDSILGSDLRLSGKPYRVIGVMAEGFAFPTPAIQIWRPFAFTPEQTSDDARGNEFSRMLARLAPGATFDQAQRQIDAIHHANMERFPDAKEFWESSGFGGMVVDYREQLFGSQKPYLLLLQAVVGFVLLIACANVANLLLTRLAARQRELALRTALGAGRWRLARQLLVESLMLALVAGFVGVWIGAAGIRLVRWLGIDPDAAGVTVRLDPGVLLFTLGLALATGVLFSLFPLFSVWRSHPNEVLKEGGDRGGSSGRRATLPRNLLVVAEMAIALVLLVGAGLMVRTLTALQSEDPGFSKENVLTAQVNLPSATYPEDADVTTFYDQTLARLAAIPGVRSASMISSSPFSGSSSSGSYRIEGYTPGTGESAPHAFQRVVDENFFETLGIPLRTGRLFNAFDTADGQAVVVVDRTLVDKYFSGEDPLGQRITRGGPDGPWLTIVGVVEPVKIRDLTEPVTKETIYYPYRQQARSRMTFVLKTETRPAAIKDSVQRAILAVDPELPAYNVVTLEDQLESSFETRRVSMVLLVAFGALAGLLAAIGIYGVLAFTIAQRFREIGIRVALGARPRQVIEMVLRQGLSLTAAGVVLGTVVALALGRLVASMLFGVPAYDPATFASVAALLLVVSLVACYRPARRATLVDPIEALRDE